MAFKITSRWLSCAVALALFSAGLCAAQEDDSSGPTTVFPHSSSARWWISGQVNIIFQTHPDFHALYSGPNSLSAQGEHATSRVLTLYTGFQINKRTEVLFDLESAGGRGI
ncbi:MAG TPA: porin, partial [Candidatus Angelobacter sp.]|nr:porin [Candidatus Angelobacter sp.]